MNNMSISATVAAMVNVLVDYRSIILKEQEKSKDLENKMSILHIHKEELQKQVVALEKEVRRVNADLQMERSTNARILTQMEKVDTIISQTEKIEAAISEKRKRELEPIVRLKRLNNNEPPANEQVKVLKRDGLQDEKFSDGTIN